ncbi:hypothetical protein [Cupriavidus metallidurans]|uniref:hypothetical protein n=1 Tax=Cupriavidus metallidurans TaxID=119219 RepID=UPI0007892B82|nr:hypothetical protein [Cupriavidus metallidurans]AVA36287.1 hypothetical protein C3Z06_23525 [Cupriavidus metallidurans]AVA36608.1 hypothetical protein C3Z06_25325 [Cupriavidus metallidurans]
MPGNPIADFDPRVLAAFARRHGVAVSPDRETTPGIIQALADAKALVLDKWDYWQEQIEALEGRVCEAEIDAKTDYHRRETDEEFGRIEDLKWFLTLREPNEAFTQELDEMAAEFARREIAAALAEAPAEAPAQRRSSRL